MKINLGLGLPSVILTSTLVTLKAFDKLDIPWIVTVLPILIPAILIAGFLGLVFLAHVLTVGK